MTDADAMSLDLSGSDLAPTLASVPDRTADERAQTTPTVRGALSDGFTLLYGAGAPDAVQAFATAVQRDGLDSASETLAARPETFGNPAGQQGLDPEYASSLGAALAGAPGHTPGLPEEARAPAQAGNAPAGRGPALGDDGPLETVLNWLYKANESTAGTLTTAAASYVLGIDTLLDAADIGLNVWRVSQPEHRRAPEAWINLATTAIGAAIPLVGDTFEAGLKLVLRDGAAAARSAMRTLQPFFDEKGVDAASYLSGLAERVPRLLTQGLDAGVGRFQQELRRLSTDVVGRPDAIEHAAAGAARQLGELADAVRRPLQQTADQVRDALRSLAAAAGGSARRGATSGATEGAERAARRTDAPRPDGPERPRRAPRSEDQLSDAGRNRPVALRPAELARVREWTAERNHFLTRWRDRDLSAFPIETRNLLRGSADQAVRRNMKPDDLAAILKENRGVVVRDATGTVRNHIVEARQARGAILNTIGTWRASEQRFVGGIHGRIADLERAGRGATPEVRILRERLGDLSPLLDSYTRLQAR